jgi:2-dehydro-3-deoxyphosphogluconate aldolase/(4S)-4-hydroxy-2-oxoglutarate aldolase
MVDREAIMARIRQQAIIAIVRVTNAASLTPCARALSAGGVGIIEFSLTSPGALEALPQARAALPSDIVLGMGTVLDGESAYAAIMAGAEFVVMPTLNQEAIQLCRRYGVPVLPGAFTPTEILRAWEWGGDMVKVFPASVLGPRYFKDIQAPLPQIPLVPVGGISPDNVADYLRAGVAAVGVGNSLVSPALVEAADWPALTQKAQAFVARVAAARSA